MSLPRTIHNIRRDPLKRAAAILAVLCLVALILIFGEPYFSNASHAPLLGSAVLSIQFAESVEEVDLILSDAPSIDREAMRLKVYIDFALIVFYTALGLALSALLARAGGWKKTAAMAAAICALTAGLFDVIENRATLALLDLPLRETTQPMIDAIRRPAQIKWILAAAAVALLAMRFVTSKERS